MIKYKSQIPETFYAGGIIYNPTNDTFLLLFRDGNTKIEPYKWAIWGGGNNPGELPHECFIREFEEESGFRLSENEVELFDEYLVEELNTYRYTFVVNKNLDPQQLKLGEGGGYATIPASQLDKYSFCPRSIKDIGHYIDKLKN